MFELAGSDVKLELVEGVVGSAQAQPQLVVSNSSAWTLPRHLYNYRTLIRFS